VDPETSDVVGLQLYVGGVAGSQNELRPAVIAGPRSTTQLVAPSGNVPPSSSEYIAYNEYDVYGLDCAETRPP
jgi:hypothetical protein